MHRQSAEKIWAKTSPLDTGYFNLLKSEGGRLALLYSHTAAMWASRPHFDRDLLYSQSAMPQTSHTAAIRCL